MAIVRRGICATEHIVVGMNERRVWLFVPNIGTMSRRSAYPRGATTLIHKTPFPKRLNLEALCLPVLRQRPLFREPRLRTLRPPGRLPAGEGDNVGDRARRERLGHARRQGQGPHAVPQ